MTYLEVQEAYEECFIDLIESDFKVDYFIHTGYVGKSKNGSLGKGSYFSSTPNSIYSTIDEIRRRTKVKTHCYPTISLLLRVYEYDDWSRYEDLLIGALDKFEAHINNYEKDKSKKHFSEFKLEPYSYRNREYDFLYADYTNEIEL